MQTHGGAAQSLRQGGFSFLLSGLLAALTLGVVLGEPPLLTGDEAA